MKKSVLVVFGGRSSEHIVSCMSAINVIKNIDTERYDVTLIGITEEGKWLLVDSVEQIEDESWRKNTTTAILSPDATEKSVIVLKDGKAEMIRIDVVFPVLHGLWGEDGTIQGIFELAKIPGFRFHCPPPDRRSSPSEARVLRRKRGSPERHAPRTPCRQTAQSQIRSR